MPERMKDCNGNELSVGDVVKIVGGEIERTIIRFDGDWAVMVNKTVFGAEVTVKSPTEQLRLVRRKEPTNG